MEKVLVTGGSGFIGTNLIDSLINEGYEVLNLDINTPVKTEQQPYYKKCNILDLPVLNTLMSEFKPNYIVHLAAITDLDGADLEYYATNTTGTQNVITAASQNASVKKIVFTSSMYVCQPGFIPADYETYKAHTVYGQSKVEGELLVKAIKDAAFEWVIIRPTSIWGPWFKIPYIDYFNTVYKGRYFDFGSTCTKTYGYVGNTVYQILKLMKSDASGSRVFYLGDLPATQISEWANEISNQMGKGNIKKIPFFVIKLASWVGDAVKLFGVNFPITSFRLTNMQTNNILPLNDTYAIAGEPPYNRIKGNEETLKWLKAFKGYKI